MRIVSLDDRTITSCKILLADTYRRLFAHEFVAGYPQRLKFILADIIDQRAKICRRIDHSRMYLLLDIIRQAS